MLTQSAKRRPLTMRPLTIATCLRAALPTVFGAVVGLLLLFGSLPATFADAPTIYSFPSYSSHGQPDGTSPYGGLIQGRDGNFYGTTASGGSQNKGTVYKVTPAGVLTTLLSFHNTGPAYGSNGLILGRDGNFYGTSALGGGESNSGTVFRLKTDGTPAGTTLRTLVTFDYSNGAFPYAPLIQARDGNFYGTTSNGGSNDNGTIFKLTTDGTVAGTTLTTLVNFNVANGYLPTAPLIQARDGSFYGTAEAGADNNAGTIFRVTTDGTAAGTTLTTLIRFSDTNGANPYAPLVQARDGSFYGTTIYGGIYNDPDYPYNLGLGTIFKLTTDGTAAGSTLTTLFKFTGLNGYKPQAPLIQGNDGSFYGTTFGNVFSERPYYGTAFKLTTDGTAAGTVLRTLATFTGANGIYLDAPLIQASDGRFYGATKAGGSNATGTIFKLSPNTFAIESLTFLPATVTGGGTTTGVVALKYVAVAATVVTLTSSNPAVLSVRSSVTVTLSHRHAVFTITTHPVTTPTDVTITATSYGVTKTSIVHVTP